MSVAVRARNLHLVSPGNKKLQARYVFTHRWFPSHARTHARARTGTHREGDQKYLCTKLKSFFFFSFIFFYFVQINQTEDVKKPSSRIRYIPDDFEVDPDFRRLVSYNTTAVHIPTDIYEGCKSAITHTSLRVSAMTSLFLDLDPRGPWAGPVPL